MGYRGDYRRSPSYVFGMLSTNTKLQISLERSLLGFPTVRSQPTSMSGVGDFSPLWVFKWVHEPTSRSGLRNLTRLCYRMASFISANLIHITKTVKTQGRWYFAGKPGWLHRLIQKLDVLHTSHPSYLSPHISSQWWEAPTSHHTIPTSHLLQSLRTFSHILPTLESHLITHI